MIMRVKHDPTKLSLSSCQKSLSLEKVLNQLGENRETYSKLKIWRGIEIYVLKISNRKGSVIASISHVHHAIIKRSARTKNFLAQKRVIDVSRVRVDSLRLACQVFQRLGMLLVL